MDTINAGVALGLPTMADFIAPTAPPPPAPGYSVSFPTIGGALGGVMLGSVGTFSGIPAAGLVLGAAGSVGGNYLFGSLQQQYAALAYGPGDWNSAIGSGSAFTAFPGTGGGF